MKVDIRLPNITATQQQQQINQLKSYLTQLVGQLNYVLNRPQEEKAADAPGNLSMNAGHEKGETSTQNMRQIKDCIIKSAEVINAYYDVIHQRLSGIFAAQSDFGSFQQQTDLELTALSNRLQQTYTAVTALESDIQALNEFQTESQAYILCGEVDTNPDGSPIIGIEIRQVLSQNGETVYKKYARFTSEKLSFYDGNDIEVAYISDNQLCIARAEVKGFLHLGGFELDASNVNGLVFRWKGES